MPSTRHAPLLPPPAGVPTWQGAAQCRTDNAVHFFAPGHLERKEEKDLRENAARALCAACPVRSDCLEHALAVREPHGIWGGLNEFERRRMLRRGGGR